MKLILMKTCPLPSNKQKRSGGFTLAEILALLFFLSSIFSVLGVSDNSLARSVAAGELNSKAHHIAQNLANRIRSNVDGLEQDAYYIDGPRIHTAINCRNTNCKAKELAASDLAEIYQLAHDTLPSAELQVNKVFGKVVQIRVLWSATQSNVANPACKSFKSGETNCVIVNVDVEGFTLTN